jgi:hypothetical protein
MGAARNSAHVFLPLITVLDVTQQLFSLALQMIRHR